MSNLNTPSLDPGSAPSVAAIPREHRRRRDRLARFDQGLHGRLRAVRSSSRRSRSPGHVPGLPARDHRSAGRLLVMAVVQIVVHVYFFLHLDPRSEERWNVASLRVHAADPLIVVSWSDLDHVPRDREHGASHGADELRRRDPAEVSRPGFRIEGAPRGALSFRARPLPRAAHDRHLDDPVRVRVRAGARLRRGRVARAGRPRAAPDPVPEKSVVIPAAEIVAFDLCSAPSIARSAARTTTT